MASANVGYPVYISILLKTPGIYVYCIRETHEIPRNTPGIYTRYTRYTWYTRGES